MKPFHNWGLLKYIIVRIIYSFFMVLGVITFIFFLSRMLPGDPVMMRLPPRRYTQADYNEMAARLGLDKPVFIQYLIYIKDVLLGNWGYSLTVVRDSYVWDVVLQRLPRTLEIMFLTMIGALIIGIGFGKTAASNRNKSKDIVIRLFAYFGICIPVFLMASFIISVIRGTGIYIFPFNGYKTPRVGNPPKITNFRIIVCILTLNWLILFDYMWHLFLPVSSVIIYQIAIITRQTRSSMIEALQTDYVRTARAKGLPEWVVLQRHALRNSLQNVLTIGGMGFTKVFAGSVVIEVAFNLAGMGQLFIWAMRWTDYPLIIAIIYLCALIVIIFNLIVDVAYAILDPRISLK